ncbi:MAG: hypothetical protein ACMUIL_06515 [bacterium]
MANQGFQKILKEIIDEAVKNGFNPSDGELDYFKVPDNLSGICFSYKDGRYDKYPIKNILDNRKFIKACFARKTKKERILKIFNSLRNQKLPVEEEITIIARLLAKES